MSENESEEGLDELEPENQFQTASSTNASIVDADDYLPLSALQSPAGSEEDLNEEEIEIEEEEEEDDEEAEGWTEEENEEKAEHDFKDQSQHSQDENEDLKIEQDDEDFEQLGFLKSEEKNIFEIEEQESDITLPKMQSRFSMSNQQVLDLIDPYNQKTFESNIERINNLLESTQKEYCLINNKEQNPETNDFRLSRKLLTKLVFANELDLAGNFLYRTVGRRLNDKDMPEIAEFLTTESNVTKLNLSYNSFGDEAVCILAGVLLARVDIYDVNLAHNDITPEGWWLFFQGLMTQSGPPLQCLKLAGNKIGKEGFDGLVCLVMCGRGPHDLDVSETDMRMEEFQGLCSAWQALDRDEDFPKFLQDHPPAIPLEVLADMKAANNEMKRQEYGIIQRRSLVELVKKDAGDMTAERGMQKMSPFPQDALSLDPVKLVEKVSASILEGLFEIPEINYLEKGDVLKDITLDRGQTKIDKIVGKAENLPDTALVIEEFKKIKGVGCIPFDDEGRPIIVCPSLYSLEVDGILDMDTTAYTHFIPDPLEDLVEGAKEMEKGKPVGKAANQVCADRAANKVVTRAIQEAAHFSLLTDYADKSDATQILLATVLATFQKVKELDGSGTEMELEALEEIWEIATKQAAKLIYQKIPPEKCSLTPEEVMAFVRKFMESSNRTLLSLLQNPYIPPLLFDVGTRVCKEIADQEDATRDGKCGGIFYQTVPNNAQRIVMSFLEGVITTAADLIGSGDPFSFRNQPASSLANTFEKSKEEVDRTEENVKTTLENMILAGASLAVDAENTNKEIDISLDVCIEPAVDFVEEAFEQVANLVIEMDSRRRNLFEEQNVTAPVPAEGKALEFIFASRPHRLVINRPLFQDFEAIMGAKMGDFLRTNTSVKCLHMRKWNLGEEGMMSLMDGLWCNSNIVLCDLGCNCIGPEGAKMLAKFIRNNSKLKHLLLNHNSLRNPGLKYITDSFLGSNVEFLNIAYNDISGDSLEQLFQILQNTKIRSLYVIGNHFSQKSYEILKNLFKVEWLYPEYCDFVLQDVDGHGTIVRNSQARDVNEWYDVQPSCVSDGLHRAPYFEETAHLDALITEID